MAVFSFRAGSFGTERELFTLDNYRQFLHDSAAQHLLWRSTGMAFLTAAFCILLAYPLAYFLSFQAGTHRLTLLTVLIVPAWTSFLLRILAWKVILGSTGALNSLLLWTGLIEQTAPTLPLSLPGILAGFLSVFIPTLGEYVTPLLVGGVNGIMYGNLIQDQFTRALNWPLGSVLSLVMLFLVVLFTLGFGRRVRLSDLAGV